MPIRYGEVERRGADEEIGVDHELHAILLRQRHRPVRRPVHEFQAERIAVGIRRPRQQVEFGEGQRRLLRDREGLRLRDRIVVRALQIQRAVVEANELTPVSWSLTPLPLTVVTSPTVVTVYCAKAPSNNAVSLPAPPSIRSLGVPRNEGVVTVTTEKLVVARAADKRVVAGSANQRVIAVPAHQGIVAIGSRSTCRRRPSR